ncbi:MAG: ubiquinone biosynthesis regulatory protein kinase UbiB [Neisseriaceae bacterium]|nr:MAG: ubiquinone biosynthesis regulatory protein kinase UbiB [Neisseriaceae bacterium]
MKLFFRFFKIFSVIRCYALLDLAEFVEIPLLIRFFFKVYPQSDVHKDLPLPQRLRMSLEELGPIFVKFGQLLSTRPDIFPKEYINELSRLQDKVPPFDSEIAKQQIEKDFKRSLDEVYYEFNMTPVASASIAQVHQAYLRDINGNKGQKVAVKVIRPNIESLIQKDLNLLSKICIFLEMVSEDARRLRLQEVLGEFKKYLHDEVNLLNEAANGSLLRRQFLNSPILVIPEIYFEYCTRNVLTLEWMDGIPISDIKTLKQKNINLKELSEFGVQIFFTQVFKNGFFHADMHPGNIFVAEDGRYIALDFGIVGSLTEHDKRYLTINFLAFFNQDYYRVAESHIECGWAPPETRVDELEAAIRYVCEPIFNQPLARISFGLLLMRLFEVSRRFNIAVQPQLVLLQKTLLNVEGLGRQLDPDLDLWKIGKPFLINWTKEQFGIDVLWENLKKESTNWSRMLPELPRKLYDALDTALVESKKNNIQLIQIQKSIRNWLSILTGILVLVLLLKVF